MKRSLIGAVVGGLIIFLWQFLSFAAINFHHPAQQHTPRQDAILAFMKEQNLPDGGYYLPNVDKDASAEQRQALEELMAGKPWMRIEYHNSYDGDMVMNMVRGLLVNIVMIYLFILLLQRMRSLTMGGVISAAVITGLIVFINAPYTNHIWYQTADIWAHLLDAVVAWGLAGAWLGWWLRRGQNANATYHMEEKRKMVA
jgi:hypothetical protein